MQRTIRAALTSMSVLLCGACASINSSSFNSARAPDGIVYKLPEKAYKTTVTYELESCGTSTEPVRVKVTDLSVASALQPSGNTSDWYVIDPTALNSLLSSVDPATIELNQGMLSKVGLKSKGTVTDVLKFAESIAQVALDGTPAQVNCTADSAKALADVATLDTEIKTLKAAIEGLDKATVDGITEDRMRKLERLDAQLAAANARRAKKVEGSLTTKVELNYVPSACAEDKCETQITPTPERFARWFGNGQNVSAWLGQNAMLTFAVAPKGAAPGKAAVPPSRMGYKGIYYRRPHVGDVTASYIAGRDTASNTNIQVTHLLNGERIPQLGTLARIGVEGTILGSRAVAVEFDSDGDLKKYEMSSTGVMTDVQTGASSIADRAKDDTELERATKEAELYKKKKEAKDAREAWEAATRPE